MSGIQHIFQRLVMKRLMILGGVLFCLEGSHAVVFAATQMTTRIKDVVKWQGVRSNLLVGYGLVVGLKGTGDTLKDSPYALETVVSMLERLGVNVRDRSADMKSKNMAAVMVTAELPAFARQGTHIDVTVSAMGTAKDLLGGTLLVTPLLGADGNVYAVAQGAVVTGGFQAEGASGSSVTKGVPTSGRIANGAIVERETGFELNSLTELNLSLRNPDFTTAKRIAEAINAAVGYGTATPKDQSTVHLRVPEQYRGRTMAFITDIEQLRIVPDQPAKVIIDENNGVIVMGQDVRISPVAVSHGNLTIKISETPQVSQPNPFSNNGQTTVVPRTNITVEQEGGKKITVLQAGVTLQQLVDSLNALGVSPRDMITILRTIKAAGALQAEIGAI